MIPSTSRRPTRAQPVLTLENVVARYGKIEVLHSINLQLEHHECLAVVGESGSGKTTTARSIAGLHRDWTGSIRLGDKELETSARSRGTESRRQIQYIFQNPYGSLNPRKTVGETVGQPLAVFGIAKGRDAEHRVGRDAGAGVACRRATRVGIPTSSPAVSASASRSRGR
ncbi:MAG: ATP-binding cassette domain-containing protein [Nocardioidaceae bacterium]